MTADQLKGLEEFETELWKIADNLRANSNLASNEYFMAIGRSVYLSIGYLTGKLTPIRDYPSTLI